MACRQHAVRFEAPHRAALLVRPALSAPLGGPAGEGEARLPPDRGGRLLCDAGSAPLLRALRLPGPALELPGPGALMADPVLRVRGWSWEGGQAQSAGVRRQGGLPAVQVARPYCQRAGRS